MTKEEKWAKGENGKGGKGKVDVPLALFDTVWWKLTPRAHTRKARRDAKYSVREYDVRLEKGRRCKSDRVPDLFLAVPDAPAQSARAGDWARAIPGRASHIPVSLLAPHAGVPAALDCMQELLCDTGTSALD